MKKRRLSEQGSIILSYILLTVVIIAGVMILNARFEYLNQVMR